MASAPSALQRRRRRAREGARQASAPAPVPRIKFCLEFEKSAILSNFRGRGFEEEYEPDGDWDIIWSTVPTAASIFGGARSGVQRHQLINHFPTHYELTRKDLLAKNWKRYMRTAAKYNRNIPDVLPTTYYIPQDFGMWYSEACRHKSWVWIVKPVGKAQGKGIFLVDAASAGKLRALTRPPPSGSSTPPTAADTPPPDTSSSRHPYSGKSTGAAGIAVAPKQGSAAAVFASGGSKLDSMYIVSRYIDNPLLVGGKKFDLRLYVLVTSWQPLQAYIHRSGFARFCAVPYTALSSTRGAQRDLDNLYMHLTNVSIQKHGAEYSVTHGGKWPLECLRAHLKASQGEQATARCFGAIRSLIRHSLLAVQPSMASGLGCFELYGYDVMLDAELKPWLIEVNASPSLTATTAADKRRKTRLVGDTLDIVMPHTRPMAPAVGAPEAVAGSGAAAVWGGGEGAPTWRPSRMPEFELLMDEAAERSSSAAAAIRSSAPRGGGGRRSRG